MIRALGIFLVASLVMIGVLGWGLGLIWSDPAAHHAIVVSGGIAVVVQLFTFALVRLAAQSNVMAGWGVGVLMRFVVLVVYALVAARALALPLSPALLSLVAFFFVTSVVEPVLLKT